jgi:peptide/nickel transport system substrate-binding protein
MLSFRSRTGRVLAALVCGLLLAGCSFGGEQPASGRVSGPPASGGTLTVAVDTEPVTWDIHVSTQDLTAELQRAVFDSLVSEDSKGTFHPWLAASWSIAPDLKSYTFRLRHDVTFTDGTPFDASAVKANFDHIVAKTTKSQYAASLLGPYTGTQVVDRYTAKVTFSRPFAPFLQAAGTTFLGFYSPKSLRDSADKLGGGGPADVGTGPFKFAGYVKGQDAVYTRNAAYLWGPATARHKGAAYLDKLVVRFLPDSAVRLGALSSGQVQVAKAVAPAGVATVKRDSRLRLLSKQEAGGNYNLWLNGSLAPLDDQRVRKAIQRGIDVGQDVKTVMAGQMRRAWSPISPATPDYDASLENSWPYDPDLAGRLLDEAGWSRRDAQGYRTKSGKRLVLSWPQLAANSAQQGRDVLGQAVQADLKKIGVQVDRPSLDVGTYSEQVYGGKANIVDLGWARFEPDVLWLFLNSASSPADGGINATFLPDARIDQWTETGRTSTDPAVRKKVYAQVQQRAIENAVVVPLYTITSLVGTSTSVQGLSFDPDSWLDFYDAWLAK